MPLVRHDVGYIGKTKDRLTNPGANNAKVMYTFRGIDDVLNYIGPILVKHGITPVPMFDNHHVEVLNIAGGDGGSRSITLATVRLRLFLYAPDGSAVCYVTNGEGREFGDDKSTAKAQTMAFKIAGFLGLMVPVSPDGLEDSDAAGEPHKTDSEGVSTRAPSATRPEDVGANRSKVWMSARDKIIEAKGNVATLQKYAKNVDKTESFSTEDRASLHRLISSELNKASASSTAK